jgi:hypothetical protein
MASSDVLVEGGQGADFVVGDVGVQAAVKDPDEPMGELAWGGVAVVAAVTELRSRHARPVKRWAP